MSHLPLRSPCRFSSCIYLPYNSDRHQFIALPESITPLGFFPLKENDISSPDSPLSRRFGDGSKCGGPKYPPVLMLGDPDVGEDIAEKSRFPKSVREHDAVLQGSQGRPGPTSSETLSRDLQGFP